MRGEWPAATIIDALAKLHPAFYAVPLAPPKRMPDGSWHHELVDDFLTRAEIDKLYGLCNRHMHRGKLLSNRAKESRSQKRNRVLIAEGLKPGRHTRNGWSVQPSSLPLMC
jgi:hypothetical protein